MRKGLSVVLALVALLFIIVAVTAPMVAASGPAILGIAAGAVAWLAWPRNKPAK